MALCYTLPMTDATALLGFEEQALPWLPDLLRYAQSLTRSRPDAEDLVQDTFLTAQRSWHQYQEGTDCRAWLFTIARHRFFRAHQRADRQVATDTPELESLASAALTHAQAQSAMEALEGESMQGVIREAIYALPEAFREVVILVDWHDVSYDVAARLLDIPVGTVRSRLFRGRRLLQQTLLVHASDYGIGARAASPGMPS